MENLEHPDITAIERNGYAKGYEPIARHFCSICGEPLYVGSYALHIKGWGWICEDCVYNETEEIRE